MLAFSFAACPTRRSLTCQTQSPIGLPFFVCTSRTSFVFLFDRKRRKFFKISAISDPFLDKLASVGPQLAAKGTAISHRPRSFLEEKSPCPTTKPVRRDLVSIKLRLHARPGLISDHDLRRSVARSRLGNATRRIEGHLRSPPLQRPQFRTLRLPLVRIPIHPSLPVCSSRVFVS